MERHTGRLHTTWTAIWHVSRAPSCAFAVCANGVRSSLTAPAAPSRRIRACALTMTRNGSFEYAHVAFPCVCLARCFLAYVASPQSQSSLKSLEREPARAGERRSCLEPGRGLRSSIRTIK